MLGLGVVWLHLLAAAVFLGGLLYEGHVLAPLLARGELAPATFREAHRRGRRATWTALALLFVTGLWNLGQLGTLLPALFQRLSGPLLAAKLFFALLVLALAAHRDFKLVPAVLAAREAGEEPGVAGTLLRGLDRLLVLLVVVILFLGVAVSRRV
ncbi:MAG: CopD family protein [Candidatus Rokubacteria bacterium]|nr:CopD family protein [Candidatus Rokubacteria bacterium]